MFKFALLQAVFCLAPLFGGDAPQDIDQLLDLSLEELVATDVETASGIDESLLKAPASIIVITSAQIRTRGYRELSEIVADLPGFDVSFSNGTEYRTFYQRGYRTPFTQRTLFMVDGKVVNNPWSHMPDLSHQYPLSIVKRIEVLYGPASAVYGPNAFLGIINVITYDGSELITSKPLFSVSVTAGEFETQTADVSVRGRNGPWSYAGGVKIHRDEGAGPDERAPWGFLTTELMNNRNIWGPLLDLEHDGEPLGAPRDPTDDYGVFLRLRHRAGLEIGFRDWKLREGYGTQYSADHALPNSSWNKSGRRWYLEYQGTLRDDLKLKALLQYRESRIDGNWAEAEPDWNQDLASRPIENTNSYISYTYWNTDNDTWLVQLGAEHQRPGGTVFSAGVKFERKDLTKAYDIPGYWGAYSSTLPATDPGPYGLGGGIFYSTDPTYVVPPKPLSESPGDNRIDTEDYGGHLLAILPFGDTIAHLGIRADDNSVYGSSVNPRLALIRTFGSHSALKLIYGEAFQEPAPLLLYGGWTGRLANPDLNPESVRNIELVGQHRRGEFYHHLSLYHARYEDVIKEEAENAGTRRVTGLEYQLDSRLRNPFETSIPIEAQFQYTWTRARSSLYYDFQTGLWTEGWSELGDISEHKFNLLLNAPLTRRAGLNLRFRHRPDTDLYLRNPLRDPSRPDGGRPNPAYTVADAAFRFGVTDELELLFKVDNLFDTDYYNPGIESADSGDDFAHRALGYRNSLLPQTGRSLYLTLHWVY